MELPFSIDSNVSSFGHKFLVGLPGPILSDTDKLNLSDLKPLGITLKRRNFNFNAHYDVWLPELTHFLSEVREACGREKLIVALENDGGSSHILPTPFTHFPSPSEYREVAGDVADLMAEEFRSLGVNVVYGPITEVQWRGARPIAGLQTFGDTSDDVTLAACIFAKKMMEGGILPIAKHFPGQGHAHKMPGTQYPRVEISQEELFQSDVRPFAALIDIGVPAIMGSNFVFAGADADIPASISPKIQSAMLRDRLQFSGVIVTGEIDTPEIGKFVTDPDAIRLALQGTCDLLRTDDAEQAIFLAQNIFDALMIRVVTEEMLSESFERIKLFHNKVHLGNTTPLEADRFSEHAEFVKSIGQEE